MIQSSVLLWLGCVTPAPTAPQGPFIDPEPVPAPETVPAVVGPEGLVINEIMTGNASTCMTPDRRFADWVELYNGGATPVDLAHVGLTDSEGTVGWVGSGPLAPGERVHLWATGEGGGDTLPFALSEGGDTVLLTWDGAPIDRIATGPLAEDTSWARYPDGGAQWAVTARPTPWSPNGITPGASIDPSDHLFDPTRVHTIEVTLSDASVRSLQGSPYTQVEGSLAFEGALFPRVGVSIKGVYGSLRSIDAKVALKLDVNDYEDHHLRGLEHVTLNNMVQDPSAVHEAVGYEFLRSVGLPAPRTGWARLVLNGEDRGFYLLIEAIDERFIARWYDDDTGRLWEGAYGVDLQADELELFQYDAGPDPLDLANLAAISEILTSSPTDAAISALEERVDVDQLLDVMAFEAIALHWDGYSTANNYRLYEDPTGRITMIPWGLDQTWIDAYFDPWGAQGLMFQFCIANTECRGRYDDALVRMADAMDAAGLDERVEELLVLVRPELATDTFREYTMETHAEYVDATLVTMRDHPTQVRALAVADRP
ncbi:MAG: CotH kinase family protein [Pseudomonadota bacterium]|nr:CotH kinase family protein [Pseudomonadota bacterium]